MLNPIPLLRIADWARAAVAPTPLPPPAKKAATRSPAKTTKKAATRSPAKTTTTKSSGSYGSSGSSGSSGSGDVKKSSDKAQVAALEQLLSNGFRTALDQRLSNITQQRGQGDRILLDGYDLRADSLLKLRTDNEMAESGSSWANIANRAREASDILIQAAGQGAGETDQAHTQLLAARNWSANQAEVNRAFYDALGSNNAAVTDLNADTRSARFNLANQALGDQEQAWSTFANQMADAATQLGNIQGNPYSDSYKADGGKKAWDQMVKAASEAWKNPGVPDDVRNWQGPMQPKDERLGNGAFLRAERAQAKRPEGATVKASGWDPEAETAKRPENPATDATLRAW